MADGSTVQVWRHDPSDTDYSSGVLLTQGTDYLFIYNSTNNLIRLVPAPGIWLTGYVYRIVLDNNDNSDPLNPDTTFSNTQVIRDLANNPLQPTRPSTIRHRFRRDTIPQRFEPESTHLPP